MGNESGNAENIEKIGQKKMSPEAQKAAEEKAEAWKEEMKDAPDFAGEDNVSEESISEIEPAQAMSEQEKASELASIRENLGLAYTGKTEETPSSDAESPAEEGEAMEGVSMSTPRVQRLYDYTNKNRSIRGEQPLEKDGESEKFDGVDIPKAFLGEDSTGKKPGFMERIRRRQEVKKFAPSNDVEETFNRLDKFSLNEQEKIYSSEHVFGLADLAVASARDDGYHRPSENALPHLYKIVAGINNRLNDPSTPSADKARLKELIGESQNPEVMIERLLEGRTRSAEVTEISIKRDKDSEMVRDDISEFAFGDRLGDIGKDLVSLGVIQLDTETRKQNIPFGSDSYLYPREYGGDLVKINEEALNGLNCTKEEADLIRNAINLMNVESSKLGQEFNNFKDVLAGIPNAPILSESIQRLKQDAFVEAGKNFKAAMRKDLEKAKNIGAVNYDGKDINVLSFGDNPYKMLVHRLGAYSEKDESNPAQWNEREPDMFDENGNPTGYIATSTLTDKNFHLAIDKSEISNPDEVFYGFADFKDDSIKAMSEYDLYTEDDGVSKDNLATMRQGVIYKDFDEFIKETENWHQNFEHLNHNEVDLARYNGDKNIHGGRIQPNYIISFQKDLSDISDTVKKHAAYFNVPIIMVDPEKYNG